MIKLRSAIAVLALSILLSLLASCSISTRSNGCDNKAESGDMLKRLNACETGWVETQRRDQTYSERTVLQAPEGEECSVWLFDTIGQANRIGSLLNSTRAISAPNFYWMGIDAFSGVSFIAASKYRGTPCAQAMETALGAKLGTEIKRLENTSSSKSTGGNNADPGQADTPYDAGPGQADTPSDGQVVVPDLSSAESPDQANLLLRGVGLKLGTVLQKDSPNYIDVPEAGTVLSQDPAPLARVQVGSAVNLTISSGKITIPDVTGESEIQANNVLVNQGFQVKIIYIQSTGEPTGVVVAQSPAGGNGSLPGSSITLSISQDGTAGTSDVP